MKTPQSAVIDASLNAGAKARPARRSLNRRGPVPLVLEQRIMFDGATGDGIVAAKFATERAVAGAAAAERPAIEKLDPPAPAAVLPSAPVNAMGRHEIVFIEDNVVGFQQLVAGVQAGVEVVVLDHTRDGMQQMIDALKGHEPVDAIHLVTHGASAQIELGSTSLSTSTLDSHRDQLAQLGQAIAPDGDLLIYGCDVAAGDSGTAFVGRLADLTQADVAASTDITGSAAFGGNWRLEASRGLVQTETLTLDREGWQGELAATTVYNANWDALTFDGSKVLNLIGDGRSSGDVVRFNGVITINGQDIDAVITTTLDRATIPTDYDSISNPSSTSAYFQPNLKVTSAGGGATFKIDFYKAGTYTGAGTGTAVTLQNVVVNSYDIDGVSSSTPDRQYQQFKGFARYELSNTSALVTTTLPDGSVTFQYTAAAGFNNTTTLTADAYRVKVYYDSMSSFQIKSGTNASGSGTLNGTAYFALDFSVGPAWTGATTITGTPAANISYSTTTFTEAAANDGSIAMTSTITLANGTLTGTDGQVLAGVTFDKLPAGLTAEVTRTSATTATLSFTGQALAHANANDISDFGVSFQDAAFTSGNAAAVTGATRADIVLDFADAVADTTAPVVAASQSFNYAENRSANALIGTVTATDAAGVTGFRFGSNLSATSADGFFSIGSDGKITITAAGVAAGAASNDFETTPNSFVYAVQARDAAGNWSVSQNVSLAVTNLDDTAPAITSGSAANAAENQNLLYTAQANDSVDFTDHAVIYSLKSGVGDAAALTINAATGAVTLASGNLDYELVASYSFTVIASDTTGNKREQAVTVAVTNVNEAPTASATSITTAEDTSKSGSLPAAADVDGDAVTYAKASDPAHGAVTVNADGTYAYTPTANYNGADSFSYTVSDGHGGSNTYTVGITVSPVNDVPTAAATSITTSEDTAKSGTLPAATDIDGDTVTYAKGSDPTHGAVTVNADGTFTYTPTANYNGADSFTYTVSDGHGGSNTYTVGITVSPVNDVPTASGTSITTSEDTAKSGTLPVAADIDGDTVTYAKASDPTHGAVTVNADGSYTYTPTANYNGADSFTYTVSDGHGGSNTYAVSVTVSPVNDAPTAAAISITTNEDTAKSGTLPVAADVDGETVTYAKASDPTHGVVTVSTDGSYTYRPTANYNGADSFTYTVSDGHGGSNTYTVGITVSPVNDAPTAAGTSITTSEDTAKSGTLPGAADIDGDTVTFAKASDPTHGTVSVNTDGSYTYTPTANYNGADSFTYTVSDGHGGSNTYTVGITVSPVNDVPTAAATSITTSEDTAKSGTLPVAADIDGDTVTYAKASDPTHGAVTVNTDGSYTYTPTANYNGADSFTYTVSDGHGGSNTYTVGITVSPVNDAPAAAGTSITTSEDTAKSGTLPVAADIDSDTVTYAKASDPTHGAVTVNTDGSYTYTPTANYNGADSFTYTVSDGHGGSNTYAVSVTVSPVNDAPTAAAISITTNEDTAKSGTLPVAADVDGDTVTYAKASDPAHGAVTVNADGTYAYTPTANYNGADSFSYTVSDGHGGSNTYTVGITVSPVNDAPAAAGTSITTSEDTAKSGTLPVAADVDGDTVTYAKASDPTHGAVTVNADGSYTYTPTANYNGADSFTYTVSDGHGGSSTYPVAISVDPVNDAPVASTVTPGPLTIGEPMAPLTVTAFTDIDSSTLTYSVTLADGSPIPAWLSFDPATRTFAGTPTTNTVGAYTLKITGSDGSLADSFSVTLTVHTPPLPAPDVTIASMTRDTGTSSTDFITSDGAANRTATGSIGAALGRNEVVQVSFDGGATWNIATTTGTNWSIADSGAHAADWTIAARITNTAANISGAAASHHVTLDATTTAMPAADSLSTLSITPVLSGTAIVGAGEKLQVTVNGSTYDVEAHDGKWTLDLAHAAPGTAPLAAGHSYDVIVTVTDAAGNAISNRDGGRLNIGVPSAPSEPVSTAPATPVPVTPSVAEPVAAPSSANEAAPALSATFAATETRSARSASDAPGSVAGGDSAMFARTRDIPATSAPFTSEIRRDAELSDTYTRSEGFRMVVAKSDQPTLVLFQGVADQYTESGTRLSLTVPADAFAHTQANAVISLAAVLQDGRPLPPWVQFNAQTGQFSGEVPKGLSGELRVKLIARDASGREATALFRINVGHAKAAVGKLGFSEQLRRAGMPAGRARA